MCVESDSCLESIGWQKFLLLLVNIHEKCERKAHSQHSTFGIHITVKASSTKDLYSLYREFKLSRPDKHLFSYAISSNSRYPCIHSLKGTAFRNETTEKTILRLFFERGWVKALFLSNNFETFSRKCFRGLLAISWFNFIINLIV